VRFKFEAIIPTDSENRKAPATMEAQAAVGSIFDQWPTFQFTSVSLELDNKGVFEKVLLPLWVNALPEGEDPETLVPRDLASATEQIMRAPATVITPASRAALTRFLRDLPHPSGKLGLRLKFAEPQQISGLTAIVSSPDEFWQRAEAVEADYVPASTIKELPPETLP
jgi:hypothetical protein